jgi:hypothetical protein
LFIELQPAGEVEDHDLRTHFELVAVVGDTEAPVLEPGSCLRGQRLEVQIQETVGCHDHVRDREGAAIVAEQSNAGPHRVGTLVVQRQPRAPSPAQVVERAPERVAFVMLVLFDASRR